jgi:hypothetical protein
MARPKETGGIQTSPNLDTDFVGLCNKKSRGLVAVLRLKIRRFESNLVCEVLADDNCCNQAISHPILETDTGPDYEWNGDFTLNGHRVLFELLA